MEDTWIREFYNETDPEARLEILNDHKLEDEIGLFMEKLWIARYGKRKPKKDLFMGYLMQMKSLSERNGYMKLSMDYTCLMPVKEALRSRKFCFLK